MASGVTFEPMLPPRDVYARATRIDAVQAANGVSDSLKVSSPELDSSAQDLEGSPKTHFWPNEQELDAKCPEQAQTDQMDSWIPLIVKLDQKRGEC